MGNARRLSPQLPVTHKYALTAVCVGCLDAQMGHPDETQVASLPTATVHPVAWKNVHGNHTALQKEEEPGKGEAETRNTRG